LQVTALASSFGELSLLRTSDHEPYFERFVDQVAICEALECPILRVDTLDTPEDGAHVGSAAAIERIAAIWNRCAEAAAAKGVTLAWEFEPCCVLNTPEEVCALVSELDRPGFGVLYDTAHAHAVAEVGARHMESGRTLPGGQPELIRTLAERIVHIHVLDSDGSLNDVPGTTIHTPIGDGDIDFSSVIPPLAAIANVRWTIDLCFWSDPAGIAAESRNKLNELLARFSPVLSHSEGTEP
jgi:sugar phosphate isomerase/epimerase